MLGILPTIFSFFLGVDAIDSGYPLGGLAALLIVILGVYTVCGLWRMRCVAAYLTLAFAVLLSFGAMYLIVDASFSRELDFIVSCVATIVGMAVIIYCLVTNLPRMK